METIRRASTPTDWDEAAALLHDHVDWIRGRTGLDLLAEQPALRDELDHLADHYATGPSALFVARWRGIAVGTTCLRPHPDGTAELKRMFVRPIARGRGIADRLVAAAVAHGQSWCARVVWLETLPGVMDAAIRVYRRNGFDPSSSRAPLLGIGGIVVLERAVPPTRRCADGDER